MTFLEYALKEAQIARTKKYRQFKKHLREREEQESYIFQQAKTRGGQRGGRTRRARCLLAQ